MGANNHSTTRPETDDKKIRGERLKRDLRECAIVTGARIDMIAPNGVVFETDGRGLNPEVISVLDDHGARLMPEQDPWEAFV